MESKQSLIVPEELNALKKELVKAEDFMGCTAFLEDFASRNVAILTTEQYAQLLTTIQVLRQLHRLSLITSEATSRELPGWSDVFSQQILALLTSFDQEGR